MNILFIGDVVSQPGCNMLRSSLPGLKKEYQLDLVIANGENSAVGNGILPKSADFLFDSGVDVITLGNHAFKRKEIYDYLEENPSIIRPANYPAGAYGKGFTVVDMGRHSVAVINLSGQVFMEPNGDPFRTADEIISKISTKLIIVDFHAEATGEKGAMGYYLDGRVSAVLGTHTHVQTADEQILPQGTGFISDAGMTGPIHSILGVAPECVVHKMTTHLPTRFEVSDSSCMLNGVLLEINEQNGNCATIKRLNIV